MIRGRHGVLTRVRTLGEADDITAELLLRYGQLMDRILTTLVRFVDRRPDDCRKCADPLRRSGGGP